MADVTISSLTQDAPAGNNILPYGTGNNTLGTAVSALFQLASHKLGIGTGNTSLTDLSKLEVVGCGDVVSSYFNVRSWARFKADNSITNYAIMFDTGAPASSVSVRGMAFGYQNTAMGVVRFDANKALGYTTDVTISSGGNVHIGGAGLAYNPVHRLEVDGTIKATALQVPGCVVQVVQTVKSDVFSTTSQSYVDVTGMSASITPKSASSKIMLMIHIGNTGIDTPNTNLFKILRNDSSLPVGSQASGSMFNVYLQNRGTIPVSFCYMDTPPAGTAYPITYKLQMRNDSGGTSTINMHNTNNTYTTISTFTLQEIAG